MAPKKVLVPIIDVEIDDYHVVWIMILFAVLMAIVAVASYQASVPRDQHKKTDGDPQASAAARPAAAPLPRRQQEQQQQKQQPSS